MAAVEVVARTGEGEAVRVFDLGPRNETMNRGPGDRIARRTCEGDCHHETGPPPQAITRRSIWNQYIVRWQGSTYTRRCWRWWFADRQASKSNTRSGSSGRPAPRSNVKAWLRAQEVSEVVMESTAQYWRP